jgi:methyl-accepting chemotaxis protein
VAGRDFTQTLDIDSKDEVGQMSSALNEAVRGVQNALLEVRDVADAVATASRQLSTSAEEIASGAQEQASSLEETAANLEEITATVKHSAENAQQASQLGSGARDTAEKGGTVVGNAVEAMGEINKASKRIADIITTIDEIAFQTNLLALNAAVEAARAGEQGRGFAVVAAEVRNLAQRSATAAKEIKGLIQDSVRKVEGGSELVNHSGQRLEEIVASVKRVTDLVAEMASATREQSSGIDQVNKAVAQMDQVTQANSAQTEELSGTAESMSQQAEQLRRLVAQFKLGDEGTRRVERSDGEARRATRPARPARSHIKKNGVRRAAASGNGQTADLDAAMVAAMGGSSSGDGEGKAGGEFEDV